MGRDASLGGRSMRTPSPTGFALLEMVVSTAVLLSILLLAIGLLQQSQAALVNANVAARDPMADFALTLLRHDLLSARDLGVTTRPGGLALIPASGGTGQVVYFKNLDRLERLDADGERRVLMTAVEHFAWWEAEPSLVEIQITYARKAQATVHVLANPNRVRGPSSTLETVRLRRGFRAGNGRRW